MKDRIKTKVAIIGCGPAGLLLSRLLFLAGIDCVAIDRKSREYIEGRIRAGVLEWSSVEVLREAGVSERMDAEGLVHDGFDLSFDGTSHRIDLKKLTGRSVMVYGQTELTKDLFDQRFEDGGEFVFEVENTRVENPDGGSPVVHFTKDGKKCEIFCDFVAGCDGYHGASRQSMPPDVLKVFEQIYPFGWLGLLVEQPPVAEEIVYTHHQRGFALCSLRSLDRSRYYIQCPAGENVEDWSDERFWEEFKLRIGPRLSATLKTGPSIEKSIAPLRSFVATPMRHNNLFLAGDAAHIVPPTGAKGLNLAVADVKILSVALERFYEKGDTSALESYSEKSLDRIWKIQRFSWYLTKLMHVFPDNPAFENEMQRAEFDYIMQSESASRTIAENYVGLQVEL